MQTDDAGDVEMEQEPPNIVEVGAPLGQFPSSSSEEYAERAEIVKLLNDKILPLIDVNLIDYQKLIRNQTYRHEMMDEITIKLGKKVFEISQISIDKECRARDNSTAEG